MAYNVNVALGSSGSCCTCATQPPCSDCKEKEPPPIEEPCDCKTQYGNEYFNVPSACESYAYSLYGNCGKCVSKLHCDGGILSHGCYLPEKKTCDDLGCVDCNIIPEPDDPCYKIGFPDGCSCDGGDSGNVVCCGYLKKDCSDFGGISLADAKEICPDCYMGLTPGCDITDCFTCQTCEDFGYSSTKLDCGPGTILTEVSPCGDVLNCYYCAPDLATCKCSAYGYYETCKEAYQAFGNCGDCETITPFPKGPCESKVCYKSICLTCGAIGESTCSSVKSQCTDKCYQVNTIEDWSKCEPPCTGMEPCCTCDLVPCSTLSPCGDIKYVNEPGDCGALVGQEVSTSCSAAYKAEGEKCYKCCQDSCPASGNFCGVLTAPCGAQQKAGASSARFLALGGPLCKGASLKLTYSFGFTPDSCSFSALKACGSSTTVGTTGCSSGSGSTNMTLPVDTISITVVCTYNCSGLDSNGDGVPNTSSIDGFSLSCIP